jgi:hypothetical protein
MKKVFTLAVLIYVLSCVLPQGVSAANPIAAFRNTLTELVPIQPGNPAHTSEPATPGATPSATSSLDSASFILKSFRATGAVPSGYVIHNWSQLNQTFTSEAKLLPIASELASQLGLHDVKPYEHQDERDSYVRLLGTGESGQTVSITLASLKGYMAGAQSTTILTIHDSAYGHKLDELHEDLIRIRRVLARQGITPQISACIQGTVSARMNDVHEFRLISKALTVVGAHRIEGVESELVDSISAYSPIAPTFIVTNGRKMNLQVAVHYDSYHQRTNVLVGTPIITVTY